MALTTPSMLSFLPFPSTSAFDVEFNVVGGSQVTQNEIEIQKQSDNSQVWLDKISSFLFKHTIPASTLVNGVSYKIRTRTYDINNQYSSWSDWYPFKCLSLPVISITNLNGGLINNQVYEFQGSYAQAQGSLLKSYRFLLYDENENLLQAFDEKLDLLLTQQITGIQNQVSYKIQLKVITQDNVEIATAKYLITGDYIQPTMNSVMKLENIQSTGGVKVTVNCVQIIGKGEIYTFENNDWINITDGFVLFDELKPFPQDYAIKLWFSNVTEDMDFLYLEGIYGENSVGIIYYNNKFHAFVEYNFNNFTEFIRSHYISNDITVLPDDTVILQIKIINNRIDLYAEIIS